MALFQFETLTFNIISVARKDHLKNHSASSIKYALYPKAWRVLAKSITLNAIQPSFEKMRAINTVFVAFNHKRTACICPTTKLASFIFKERRLSQASLELSSSRGVFASLESKGKRREKREKQNPNENTRLYLQK